MFFVLEISNYVLRIRDMTYLFLAIGDPIVERDRVDVIIQGLPEEYNPFIMMIYGKVDTTDIYEV